MSKEGKGKTTIRVYRGETYKYYRARMCDEYPALTMRAKRWFLFKLDRGTGKWEFEGDFRGVPDDYIEAKEGRIKT
jgi:hypothetical protein